MTVLLVLGALSLMLTAGVMRAADLMFDYDPHDHDHDDNY